MTAADHFKTYTAAAVLKTYAAAPLDNLALEVLADAVEDLGTSLSEGLARGCRALALHDLRARYVNVSHVFQIYPDNVPIYMWYRSRDDYFTRPDPDDLFADWYLNLPHHVCYSSSRAAATVGAVLGFAALPLDRQNYLLAPASVIHHFSRCPSGEYTNSHITEIKERAVSLWARP